MEGKVIAAAKGIIFHKGKVLILKRSKETAFWPGFWEFPGGKLDFGEDFTEGLIREVAEETGISVLPQELLYAQNSMEIENKQFIILHYLCRLKTDDIILSEEHDSYKWVLPEEIPNILNEKILFDFMKNETINYLKKINHA